MMRQYELVERVRDYDPAVDEDMLNRAYVFTVKAHGAQKRASGDPYFSHPVEVAGILTGYRLDSASIATALLHDTVEDTDVTIEEIDKLFGNEVARLVDGVTKLSLIELQSADAPQAENFRKLVLAMSEDIRVLLVKLADRLHNMRTLEFVKKPEKRERIARETLEIYAPLAERIGMRDFQEELEDLAFRQLHPDARESIVKRLAFLRDRGDDLVPRIIKELGRVLKADGVECGIDGREKRPYSIWKKMQREAVSFEQLSDIMAFRMIVKDLGGCYRALGAVHGAYRVVPGRFKDYISLPKPNGYKSLHTGVFGPEGQRIEIQIRTQEMHEFAEHGLAAHWRYKQGGGGSPKDGKQYKWLRDFLDILEHAHEPEEFLEHTKLEMFQDQVFCFTPGGDIISLPNGATPVDFAYAVHTEVGNTCVGAKVNGRMVPLRSVLRNGDQVEIVTSKAQHPSPEWERFVVTGKARACIRRYVRSQQREQYLDLGREILQKAFRQSGHELTHKVLDEVLRKFKADTVEDLMVSVGEGINTGTEVLHAAIPGTKEPERKSLFRKSTKPKKNGKAGGDAIEIKGLIPGMAVHFAGCCHPLPGERIVGIVSTGRGVTIHTIDCDILSDFHEQPERWLDVSWSVEAEAHIGRLYVVVANEPGTLGDITTVIGRNEGNISNLKFTSRHADFFEMMIDVEVDNVRHLTNIIAALRATPVVSSVQRAKG